MKLLGRRRRHAETPSEPSDQGETRVAVLTMVRDEARMLPVWIRHYAAQVGMENLYVLDDNSVDGSTDALSCNVIRLPAVRGGRFESTRMRVVSGFADGLLGLYDAVLFTDADEFVVADPSVHANLVEFAASRRGREAVGVIALNVLHNLGSEPPLDLEKPILGQRTLAKFIPLMCKPSLSYSGARWVAASHGIRADYEVDPELFMFHLKFADRDLLHDAAEHRRRMVDLDGRSGVTSWRRGGEELVGWLEQINADLDPEKVQEFVPPSGPKLSRLVVVNEQGAHRARKGGRAIHDRPVVRIPERFLGAF